MTTAQRPLNARNLAFCRYVVADNTGSESYRLAGYSEKNANVAASQLLAKPAIQQEIGRLRAIEHRDGATTRAYVIARLSHFSEHAKPDSAAIRATELLGKTERMFIEVSEKNVIHHVPELEALALDVLLELREVQRARLEAPVETTAKVLEERTGVREGDDGEG